MNTKEIIKKLTALLIVVVMLTETAYAQDVGIPVNFEVQLLYAQKHKAVGALNSARMVLEEANKDIQKLLTNSTETWKKETDQKEAYEKAFNIVSLVINGLTTAKTAIETFNATGKTIDATVQLAEKFIADSKKYGLKKEDIQIVEWICADIEVIGADITNLIELSGLIVTICSSKQRIKLTDLNLMFDNLNYQLERLSIDVRGSYKQLMCYVNYRSSFYKKGVYHRVLSPDSIVSQCRSRWDTVPKTTPIQTK